MRLICSVDVVTLFFLNLMKQKSLTYDKTSINVLERRKNDIKATFFFTHIVNCSAHLSDITMSMYFSIELASEEIGEDDLGE